MFGSALGCARPANADFTLNNLGRARENFFVRFALLAVFIARLPRDAFARTSAIWLSTLCFATLASLAYNSSHLPTEFSGVSRSGAR